MHLHQLWQQIEQRKKIDDDLHYSIDCWKESTNQPTIDYRVHVPTIQSYFDTVPKLVVPKYKDEPWFHELEIVESHHDLGVSSSQSHPRQHVSDTLYDRISSTCLTQIGKQWIYHTLLHPTHDLPTLNKRRETIEWFQQSTLPPIKENLTSMEAKLSWLFQDLKPEIQVLLTKIYLQWDWFSSISDWLNTSLIFHRGMHAFKMFMNPCMQIVLPLLIVIGSMFGTLYMVRKTGWRTTMQFWYQIGSYIMSSQVSARSKITFFVTIAIYVVSFIYNIYQSIRETLFLQSIFEQLHQSILPVLSMIRLCKEMQSVIPSALIPSSIQDALETSLPTLLSCVHPSLLKDLDQYRDIQSMSILQRWFLYPRSEIAVSFYQLYQQKDHIIPCISFIGWMDAYQQLASLIKQESRITWATYREDTGHQPYIRSKGIYYPLLHEHAKNVPNPVRIDTNYAMNRLITGPNAAGKSTYLKSIGLNQHLAQTFGFVFAKSYTCCLFEQFHSQLQLQDLKGAYSLFEAEMMRCQTFMERIQPHAEEKKRSLCLFDELFSSTNAQEGFAAAFAFVEYCIQMPHIAFMMTTHYSMLQSLGKKYPHLLKIIRFDVERDPEKGTLVSTYKMKPGASKQCIALELLSYQPTSKEWIERAKDILKVLQGLEAKQCRHLTKWIMNSSEKTN